MIQSDFEAFSEIVLGFAELKGKVLSKAGIKLYWNSMQHWSIEDFRRAANQLVRTCAWVPSPKEFEDLRKAAFPTGAEAWDMARKASGSCRELTRAGAFFGKGGTCGDELIDRAVAGIGGYAVIAMSTIEQMPFLEKRFCEHYKMLMDVEGTREALPQLMSTSKRQLKGPASIQSLLTREPYKP